ncbi:MAG: hypothetical protein U9R08_02995 [Nanoarchaeota archaeon]|nr:hypothetical protein [Nanoarchaeota archaeon]
MSREKYPDMDFLENEMSDFIISIIKGIVYEPDEAHIQNVTIEDGHAIFYLKVNRIDRANVIGLSGAMVKAINKIARMKTYINRKSIPCIVTIVDI